MILGRCRRVYSSSLVLLYEQVLQEDESNCTLLKCQSLDENNEYMTNYLIETVENIQCVDSGVNGRCFRGICRPESKLLQHVASGKCLKPESGFGVSGAVVMITCPTSK